MDAKVKNKTYFLSLKWKVLLLLSLLLIVTSSGLAYLGYQHLQRLFETQLSTAIEINSSTLLNKSKNRLVELSTAIALAGETKDVTGLTEESLQNFLQNKWDILQINWGMESVVLFDGSDNVVSFQGTYSFDENIISLVEQVTTTDQPATRIFCDKKCRIYAAVPLLFSDSETKTMVVSAPLVDFIIDFSEQNSMGAALLRRQIASVDKDYLQIWDYRVVGINDKIMYQPLLDQLQKQVGSEDFIGSGRSLQSEDGRFYYFYAISIESHGNATENIIVLITDITKQQQDVYHNLIFSSAISLAELMATLLILFLILIGPMSRIKRQADLLPLLAESGFDTVRKEIAKRKRDRPTHDELDILEETAVSLSHQLELMESEIQGRTRELEYMALYDVLTGLANRRHFTEQLRNIIKSYEMYGERFAVVFIDLDNFKRVNDSLGHDAGDALLVEVSQRLSSCVRSTDVVARLGGDEFTLLLPQVMEVQNIIDIMDKILASFQRVITVNGKDVAVTPSIGISVGPENGVDTQELMRCADLAMYEAKQRGKNCYHFFTEEMNENVQQLIRIENELHHGIDYSQFRLYYQPIIDLNTGEITSLEGLLRWKHPIRGILSPVDFIDILETNGQIVLLGAQIFEIVCLDLLLLQQAKLGDLVIAVNMSTKQFNDLGLLNMLTKVFKTTGVSASSIKLEITENTLMVDIDRQIGLMHELKNMGFTLSIDDFGTGFSSLNYLKQLPVDELKIDRSFIVNIVDNMNDMEITSAVTAMAHRLKLKVVAEGIETAEQEQLLNTIGCDYGQGYLYHRPAPLEKLIPYLQEHAEITVEKKIKYQG